MTDPQNPNRLAGSPALGEPALGLSPVAIVEKSPTGIAVIGQTLVKVATGAKALALVVGGIVALIPPTPWTAQVLVVCAGVYGISELITGAGPGIRKEAGTQPVLPWEGRSLPPAAPSDKPRMGPPL